MQMYDRGKGLAFHFDKDETMMAQQQIMHQPALSSILYLTGSSQSDRLGAAPCTSPPTMTNGSNQSSLYFALAQCYAWHSSPSASSNWIFHNKASAAAFSPF